MTKSVMELSPEVKQKTQPLCGKLTAIAENKTLYFANIQGYFFYYGRHLSVNAKYIYTCLNLWKYNKKDQPDWVINPSLESLCQVSDLSKNRVLMALNELVYFGWIRKLNNQVDKSKKAKKYRNNEYIFTIPINVEKTQVNGIQEIKLITVPEREWDGKRILISPKSKQRRSEIKCQITEYYSRQNKNVDYKKLKEKLKINCPQPSESIEDILFS